jgi:hypothetical protein
MKIRNKDKSKKDLKIRITMNKKQQQKIFQDWHEKGIGGYKLIGWPYTGNTPAMICDVSTCKVHAEKANKFIGKLEII